MEDFEVATSYYEHTIWMRVTHIYSGISVSDEGYSSRRLKAKLMLEIKEKLKQA